MASAKKLLLPSHSSLQRPAAQVNALDASGEKLGIVFQAEEDATITHVAPYLRQIVGTSPTYTIGLQGVGSTGNPDGTYLGGGSPASATFNPTSLSWAEGFHWVALDNSIAVSRGDLVALVIEYSSGTIDGSNHSRFGMDSSVETWRRPYWLFHNGTSWSKQASWSPLWGYKSSSNVYGNLFGINAATQETTSGNRLAAKFAMDSNWGDTFKIRGFDCNINSYSTGGSITCGIWNAAGAAQQTVAFDTDVAGATSTGWRRFIFSGTLATLSFGTTYYIGFENTGTNFWLEAVQLTEANDLKAFPGEGEFALSEWNGLSWNDDADAFVQCRLLLDDWTEPAGGGGGILVHPGMGGGMRG